MMNEKQLSEVLTFRGSNVFGCFVVGGGGGKTVLFFSFCVKQVKESI